MAGLPSAIVRARTCMCSRVQVARYAKSSRRWCRSDEIAGRANEASRGRKSNESERARAGVVIKPQAKFPTVRSTRHASPRLHIPFPLPSRAATPFIINAIRSYYAPLPYALPRSSLPQSRHPLSLSARASRVRNSSPYS